MSVESDSPLRIWLGKQITVVVNRPLGSHHPRHPDIVYPVNYGDLPDTEAPDGHPIDAYILGVDVPVESFTGDGIAVVIRHDDVEDKLVVAPPGTRFSSHKLREAVHFQEQYFRSEIVMRSS